jgi:tRNA 2-selenouridine synthase
VYCWRGGQRSGAFSHILREIGWDAQRLQGGYKAWRRHVIEQLACCRRASASASSAAPPAAARAACWKPSPRAAGRCCTSKNWPRTRARCWATCPDTPQPAQKGFESQLLATLSALDPARPVFVEAESRKIGRLQVPDALLEAIRGAPGLRIEAPLAARVDFLLHDYDYAVADPAWLVERLGHLRGLQSNETLERWQTLIAAGAFPVLVRSC